MKKKRNKKYIPLEQKIANSLRGRVCQDYEFEMSFVIEDVNKIIDDWYDKNNKPNDAYCPEWLVVSAYGQQDLIIALKTCQIKDPTYWEIGIDSHFLNVEKEDVYTIPLSVELPEMSHAELNNGCDVKVNRGGGIKTRWKGLQNEMLEHWENQGTPEGYDLVKSQIYFKAIAKFKSASMLREHENMLKARKDGTLISKLKLHFGE